jgi:hypothetical protein
VLNCHHDLFYSNIYFLSDNINRMKKAKTRGAQKIKGWATKGRKSQRGGFVGIIIASLIALGVEAGTAASVAAVAAPIVSGVASASAGYAATKILSSGDRRAEHRAVRTKKRADHRLVRSERHKAHLIVRDARRKAKH